nr:hypothetical protein [Propionicimonas sp.]
MIAPTLPRTERPQTPARLALFVLSLTLVVLTFAAIVVIGSSGVSVARALP